MEKYFNRVDREHNLAMLIFYLHMQEWIARVKSLTPEELKWIKTGCTFIKKAAESMIKRSDRNYQRAILNQSKTSSLIVQEERPSITGEKYVDTIQLVKDDFFDLCEKAVWKCGKCGYKDWKECGQFLLFMKLGVPIFDGETDDCPYRM